MTTTSIEPIPFRTKPGFEATLRGRIVISGVPVTQAQIDSIAYRVSDVDLDQEVTSGTLDVATVIYDTLQKPANWHKDDEGVNFIGVIPAAGFPIAGRSYMIEIVFTPNGSPAFPVYWLAEATIPAGR